jgi:hypothetical protein
LRPNPRQTLVSYKQTLQQYSARTSHSQTRSRDAFVWRCVPTSPGRISLCAVTSLSSTVAIPAHGARAPSHPTSLHRLRSATPSRAQSTALLCLLPLRCSVPPPPHTLALASLRYFCHPSHSNSSCFPSHCILMAARRQASPVTGVCLPRSCSRRRRCLGLPNPIGRHLHAFGDVSTLAPVWIHCVRTRAICRDLAVSDKGAQFMYLLRIFR